MFLLHHTHEGRIGLCHEKDGQQLAPEAIIARLSYADVVGLSDDIWESFTTCFERGDLIEEPDEYES